jgi:hypothetical protein
MLLRDGQVEQSETWGRWVIPELFLLTLLIIVNSKGYYPWLILWKSIWAKYSTGAKK